MELVKSYDSEKKQELLGIGDLCKKGWPIHGSARLAAGARATQLGALQGSCGRPICLAGEASLELSCSQA